MIFELTQNSMGAWQLKLDGALPGLFKGALLSGDFDAYILKQLQQGILE